MSFYRDFNDKLAIQAWNSARREPYRSIEVRQLSPVSYTHLTLPTTPYV